MNRSIALLAFGAAVVAGCASGATIGANEPAPRPSATTPSEGATTAPGSTPAPVVTVTPVRTATPSPGPSASPTSAATNPTAAATMSTVGTTGNEPTLEEDPAGNLFISALANLYRSEDSGKTWTLLPPPTIAATVLASDSSIAFDPSGKLYYTFDYPYAGNTAVCVSSDQGTTFSCNPAVVPGGTDRMWVTAPENDEAYETTNEGLYQTAFLTSTDGGTTWLPQQLGDQVAEPSTGPVLKLHNGAVVLQVLDQHPGRVVYRYVLGSTSVVPSLAGIVSTGVASGESLPSSDQDTAGNYYLVGEPANAAGGTAVQVGRSTDQGQTFSLLPPIPQTLTGTATFTAIAAGKPGHIVVLYYYSTANSTDPTTMNAPWSAQVAETYDAFDAIPMWTVTTLEPVVHVGGMCANAGCTGDTRYSGDFISALIDKNEHVNLTWMDEPGTAMTPTVRFERLH